MIQEELTGKVQTVLGLIDANSLEVTLTHEHLLCDVAALFVEPTEASEKRLAHEPVSLENLYWVWSHCFTSVDDQSFCNEQLTIKEVMAFKEAGGNTLVELSNIGLSRSS